MNTYKKKNSCCFFFFFIIFNEIFFINEQESFPEGLKIDSKNKKITITLGDNIDLKKILIYLKNTNLISETLCNDRRTDYKSYWKMRFEINGKNEKDKYSYTIDKDISFAFHERYIEILFKENNKDIFIFNNFFLFLDDDIKKNLTKDTRLELLKDSRSNLSWIHTHKNGKVYMLKHYNDNNECSVCDDTYPDPSNIEDWKPIKQTLGSNIKYWKYLNISDYKSIQEKDRPSPIKRFLRTFVTCQDGMTGECLLDPECFNCCTTSGYNEESFYSKENVDKKGSQEIEQ